MLIPDIQWREQYTSASLNRKLAGIIEPGIYEGFTVEPVAGENLKLAVVVDGGVAVVERDGYSITVHGSGDNEVVDTHTSGTGYIVIEVFYDISKTTTATLKALRTPLSHHCVLAKYTIVNGVAVLANSVYPYSRDAIIDCGGIE